MNKNLNKIISCIVWVFSTSMVMAADLPPIEENPQQEAYTSLRAYAEDTHQKGCHAFSNLYYFEEASEAWRIAALLGNAEAQYDYGVCLEFGIGVKENKQAAYALYQIAAGQGHAASKGALIFDKIRKTGSTSGIRFDASVISKEDLPYVTLPQKVAYWKKQEEKENKSFVLQGVVNHLQTAYGNDFSEQEYSENPTDYFLSTPKTRVDEPVSTSASEEGGADGRGSVQFTQEQRLWQEMEKTVNDAWFFQCKEEEAEARGEAKKREQATACLNLGYCYEKIDRNKARELYKQARECYTQAQAVCPVNGLEELNAKKHFDFPHQWYQEGIRYVYGIGVEKNNEEAVRLYRLATNQGYAPAQFKLGLCYEYGRGVEKDLEEAVSWYRLAANQGYAAAQYALGLCYNLGRGVEKDLEETVRWYRLAANQGYAVAQYVLGKYYEYGQGVTKDLAKAVDWYRLAANQGYADAQYNLGWCYKIGRGVEKNNEEEVRLYRLAANQGYAVAQYNLGWCYENGEGVTKDLTEAVRLYRLAADWTFEDAIAALQRLDSQSK